MNTAAYVIRLSVVAVAMGILLSMMPSGTSRTVLRLSGSILLTVIALSPLTELDLSELSGLRFSEMTDGETLAAMGMDAANDERNAVILDKTTAYILDKAAALGVEITAQVELDGEGIPESVWLQGNVPELIRRRLSYVLEQELGIPKEKQEWILRN
ncbi:MAG: hypothetical protein IKU68_03770 [Oscillospiraceae bacterium]|nr:hypothetical protein [Oscillospiraceae bacterium]